MISILVIEEQTLFRCSLVSLINSLTNFNVIGDYASAKDALAASDNELPNIVFLSLYSINGRNLSEIQRLKEKYYFAKVCILSDYISREELKLIANLNVDGFISRHSNTNEMERIMQLTVLNSNNNELLVDTLTRENLSNFANENPIQELELTQREREVLNLVCYEKTNIEISETLGLSVRTVESFRRRMIDKAGCRNMIGVVLRAIRAEHLELASF